MKIKHFRELDVYQNALNAAMQVFELSMRFPKEERFEPSVFPRLDDSYDKIIGQLVNMATHPEKWTTH